MTVETLPDFSVAIIGIACRFPGAANVSEFWQNLRNGIDCISHFTEEEMRAFGVREEIFSSPDFVRASPILPDIDRFDASFFGVAPKDAALMDPQHRFFLECAWASLESAGYKPDRCPQPTGVFAGTSLSSYLLYNLLPVLSDPHAEDSLQAMIGNDKDFLSTRVSYKLNLHGPSIDVQTGCSTSLVAVHLACQSLLSYQCDMALAGGVSIQTPQRRGYMFQPGGLCSSDGRCRAFDSRAEGTVFGSGVGIVVLKRLNEAVADRDHVIAVIRGSAVNNDGSAKLGYTAPSVVGQAQVIRTAQSLAQVEARSIGYVECHGTATPLGDPAEIMALTNAFRTSTSDTNFCAIGSVKTNIGHLDAAAGVAGLIKTALAIEHGELPPSLHFEEPNPQIEFASTPFYINNILKEWPSTGEPLRAGVSSFGIGGTNAHVVLEEARKPVPAPSHRTRHLFCISARTQSALDGSTERLAEFLSEQSQLSPADVAYTLQTGRDAFRIRRAVVSSDIPNAAAALRGAPDTWSITQEVDEQSRDVVFMFPGGGSQHLRMGEQLYATEPTFRRELDRCSEILQPMLHCDLRSRLFPKDSSAELTDLMRGTAIGLPALFSIEYALARLWMEWGLRPSAMIGHSLGEYTAACLAGVLSLEDALSIVSVRSRLMSQLPQGAMLSIPLSKEELKPFLTSGLSIAVVNGPSQTVASGTAEAIEYLAKVLEEREIEPRRLQISVASHSALVEPMLPEFQDFLAGIHTNAPQIPYISNLTGDWITPELATDKLYWVRHLRQTVQFHAGIERLLDKPKPIFLEVGPGNALTTLTQSLVETRRSIVALSSMRHPYDQESDDTFIHRAAAKLWAYGAVDDWLSLYNEESRRRVPLPTYAFDKQRHWIEAPSPDWKNFEISKAKTSDFRLWFYVPGWRSVPILASRKAERAETRGKWLVFISDHPVCEQLVEWLRVDGHPVVVVRQGTEYSEGAGNEFTVRAQEQEDYTRLLSTVSAEDSAAPSIVHLWNMSPDFAFLSDGARLQHVKTYGLLSLSRLLRSLVDTGVDMDLEIAVVSDHVFQVDDQDEAIIEKSLLVGPCRVIPQENPGVRCRLIDVGPGAGEQQLVSVQKLWNELFAEEAFPVVSLRGSRRWIPDYPQARLPELVNSSLLREHGVYLLLGGTGEIGLQIAHALFNEIKARLVIVTHRGLPPQSDWDSILLSADESTVTSRLRSLARLKQKGAEILVLQGDVSNTESTLQTVQTALDRYGAVHGIFHLAGATGESVVHLNVDSESEQIDAITIAKVMGVRNIEHAMNLCAPDFVLQFSSTAAVLGGVGLSTYGAANAVVESAAVVNRLSSETTRWISMAWDAWLTERYVTPGGLPSALQEYALKPDDAIRAMFLLLNSGADGPFIISSGNMNARYRQSMERGIPFSLLNLSDTPEVRIPTWDQSRPYVPPFGELEETIASAWREHLGVAHVGREDKFFELGGSSLLALRIVSRLKKALGMEIPVTSVFEGVSVRGMAELLSAQDDDNSLLDTSRSRGAARRRRHEEKSDEGVLVN